MNLSMHWSWNMLLLNCLNHTVLAWFLGGLPQNCQVLPTRARGFHDTTASLGKYRPTVYPILNLSLRGVNIIYPAPGRWSLLGEAQVPEGVSAAAASKGQGGCPKHQGPQGRSMIWLVINQMEKKSLVDGREEDHIVHDMCPTLTWKLKPLMIVYSS